MKKKYEGIPEEVRNKFELVHLPSQVTSQNIPNNQIKWGEEISHDTKEKRKEISENEFDMKDKEKKKRKNGYFKKRDVAANCETCDKIHTGSCYLKTSACFRYGQIGYQVRNCPINEFRDGKTTVTVKVCK